MKIALDASGGDFGIEPNILGAAQAVKDLKCEVVLAGKSAELEDKLRAMGIPREGLTIVDAPDTVEMDEDPSLACRKKKCASVVVCADLVKKGEADAFVSAGNSGATMVAALMKMGRIDGVLRPAIGAAIPSLKGFTLLLDAGANTECKPQHLLQFAVMGSIYSRKVFNIKDPVVGLLSIGEEEGKGTPLVKETYPHLKKIGVNFFGNVEGRDINTGEIDVVVTDGFTGNICLKLCEGLAKSMLKLIKREITKSPLAMAGAFMSKNAFRAVKDLTDPDTAGGAPLLGIDGVAIVSHGKSGKRAIFNAIKTAKTLAESGFVEDIRKHIAKYKDTFDSLEDERK